MTNAELIAELKKRSKHYWNMAETCLDFFIKHKEQGNAEEATEWHEGWTMWNSMWCTIEEIIKLIDAAN